MVDRRIPRVQEILFPVMRERLTTEYPGLEIVSWYKDVSRRSFPFIGVRRLGGNSLDPKRLDMPVIEMTAYTRDGLVATENLYLDAREVVINMVENQTLTEAGYLHSYYETMGPTPFDSPFEDSWRVQGLIQVGVRPRRN